MTNNLKQIKNRRRVTIAQPLASRNAEETRARVLDTAAHLFNERGYRGATMRHIAQESGIEAGSLYYHFGSKEVLLSVVFELCMNEVLSAVKQAVDNTPQGSTWRDRIRNAMRAHIELLAHRGDYTSTNIRMFAQAPNRAKVRGGKLRIEYENYWKNLLSEASRAQEIDPDVDLALARPFLLGALNWTSEWYQSGKGISLDRLANTYTQFLFDGLKKTKRQTP